MNLMCDELKAPMCLISSAASSLVDSYLPDVSFLNANTVIYSNELNSLSTLINANESFSFNDLDCLELNDVDLTGSLDAHSLNQEVSLNAFDLNDSDLFSFINEIDLSDFDNSNLAASPVTSESFYTESNYDSFSATSSPSTNSEDSEQEIHMVKTKRRVDKRESNKAAACRYRSKKSQEKNELFAECEREARKNRELSEKINDIQAEITSIRNLLLQALLLKENILTSNKNILTPLV